MSDPSPLDLAAIVRRALELPAHSRRAFVTAACGDDVECARRALEQIGAASPAELPAAASATIVGGPDESLLSAHRAVAPDEMLGQCIGPYRLLKVIGEGGFGTVFLAEQSQPVTRQVAFKMLKPGMDSRQIVARFEQERQALALMDHPNIAKVFDAGTTERGLPFFVMELCRGEALVSWCDRNRWDLEQRLGLFVQVCHAVQHAHGKGIIHRDLKPSNVLVGAQDGVATPKVIDFGIAKAMSQRLTDKTFVTEAEQVIGTLKYMSPEQAEGSLDIDTRADVYSLGAVLYELLTGTTPFDDPTQEHPTQHELHRRIREQDPPRPSTRISQLGQGITGLAERRRIDPNRLPARVRGELDWIVMKAIERDRTRRYATALELAQDVQRFLDGEPVLAAPPSTAYILSKFVRRNRTAVLGAAGMALALVGGAIAFAWQAKIARDQRDFAMEAQRAESKAREQAEEVASVMESVFEGIDPRLELESGFSLQDQLRQRLEGMVSDLAHGDGDPLTRARLQFAFGRALLGLADFEQARLLLRESLATRRELLGPSSSLTVDTAEALSAAEVQLGNFSEALAILEALYGQGGSPDADLMLGMAYRAAGRRDEAIAALERQKARIERAGPPDTDMGLLALHALGACYREAGRIDDAVELLEDVLARRSALLGADHSGTLSTCNSLAVAYSDAGRLEESLAINLRARERMLERFQPDHLAVIAIDANIATTLGRIGRANEGIELLEPTRARARAKYPEDHPDNLRMDVALGRLYHEAGREEEALKLLREAAPRIQPARDLERNLEFECRLATARCLARLQRIPEALVEYEWAAARAVEDRGVNSKEATDVTVEWIGWLRAAGRHDESLAGARRLVERKGQLGEFEDSTLSKAWGEIGATCFATGKFKEAAEAFEQALELRERLLGPDAGDTILTRTSLAAALWADRKLDRSLPLELRCFEDAQRVFGKSAPETSRIALDLALHYRDLRKDDELFELLRTWLPAILKHRESGDATLLSLSRGYLSRCQSESRHADMVDGLEAQLALLRDRSGPDHDDTLANQSTLGTTYWWLKRYADAVPVFRDLAERTLRKYGPDDFRACMAQVNLGVNLRDSGQPREALPVIEEISARLGAAGRKWSTDREFCQRELARTLAACGQRKRCADTVADLVACVRAAAKPGERIEGSLTHAAIVLLDAGLFAEAEPLLAEALRLRESAQPQAWSTSFGRVLLGDCLHGLARDAEARVLLERGASELRSMEATVPSSARHRLSESADRIVRFLGDIGDEAAAAPWREWHEQLAASQP